MITACYRKRFCTLLSMKYDLIVAILDQLIDEVGEDERHPLASLMEVLSVWQSFSQD
jgi:hypothetical protein